MAYRISTPLGTLSLEMQQDTLLSCLWSNSDDCSIEMPILMPHTQNMISEQLMEYCAGQREVFDVQIALSCQGTSFQQQVWRAVMTIPYGQTRSYQDIANLLGKPKSARAVGQAVGANPFHIVIPCHRVIAANGCLGGYAAGPLKKADLLNLEANYI